MILFINNNIFETKECIFRERNINFISKNCFTYKINYSKEISEKLDYLINNYNGNIYTFNYLECRCCELTNSYIVKYDIVDNMIFLIIAYDNWYLVKSNVSLLRKLKINKICC